MIGCSRSRAPTLASASARGAAAPISCPSGVSSQTARRSAARIDAERAPWSSCCSRRSGASDPAIGGRPPEPPLPSAVRRHPGPMPSTWSRTSVTRPARRCRRALDRGHDTGHGPGLKHVASTPSTQTHSTGSPLGFLRMTTRPEQSGVDAGRRFNTGTASSTARRASAAMTPASSFISPHAGARASRSRSGWSRDHEAGSGTHGSGQLGTFG